MFTLAVIQARVGSSRLPGKVLADVGGRPLLWYVIRRVELASRVDQVVVAIPDTTADLAIAQLCAAYHVPCVTGPEDDVLARYQLVVKRWTPRVDRVVRITADCPLVDPSIIDAVVDRVEHGKLWATNIVPRTFPDGLDVEVLTPRMLDWLDQHAYPEEREHVTAALYRAPDVWNAGAFVRSPLPLGKLRWTVDTAADLEWLRAVYRTLPRWDTHWGEILLGCPGAGRVA